FPEACRKYGLPQGEFREWAEEYHGAGVDALKINRKGLEAGYRAEIKRLQAKIGEFVMENEIRKEALRIVPLDEREQQQIGSLLGHLDRKPSSAES
ncbi:MAG TPA: hypothetical protein VKX96_02080, partial [Chloroflexota bacterium]|nr:hypothetical protein [Chloroflexota bacterium]